MATDTPNESLADILARIEARYISPAHSPAAPRLAERPLPQAHQDTPSLPARMLAPWSAETMAIPAEVFLETLGFFTPSSKRLRGIYTKEKVNFR